MESTIWHLTEADGTELGRLELVALDMPWIECRFTPALAFEPVAPLFAEELALLNRDEMDAWEVAYDRITGLNLELRPESTGPPIREFILHVDGEQAWFRY